MGWLTNDSRVQRTVFQDNILNSFQLFTLQQIAAVLAAADARIPLAKMAVAESGMGIVEDKVIKNHF
ncbi:hypothetical protein EVY45_23780, partial [Escherichia coli]